MLTAKNILPDIALAVAILTCSSICFAECAADTCSAFLYPGSDDVDIKIAAIYGVHVSNGTSCSELPRLFTVQIAIAMQWAASLLNGDNSTGSYIPGVKIGVDIYDDCNQEYLAARHAGTVASHSIDSSDGQCTWDEQSSQDQAVPIAGIIGTTRSQTTTLVTKIARFSNIPVVGIAATLAELSDKTKYPGFTRATPNDHLQAKAIIDMALKFKWSYIVGISTNDNYGQMGMSRLQDLAADHRICISVVTSLDIFGPVDERVLSSFVRETLFDKVRMSNGSLGVLYFGQNEGLVRLLSLVQEWSKDWLEALDNLKRIHWMVSDAVALDTDLIKLVKLYETRVVGVDMVTSEISSFRDFQQEFLMSPPTWAREGRWRLALETLATEHFGCTSYNASDETGQAAESCTLPSSNIFSGYLATTVDAVYLLANTLKIMHSTLCLGQEGVCDSLREELKEGILASHSLSHVDYTTLNPSHVPPEFVTTGRALVPDGGDFLVRNQSLYTLMANQGDQFVEIGSYSIDGVELLTQTQGEQIIPGSECSKVCTECHDLGTMSYEFVDGDYVILGIFSLHWKAVDVPFKCGAFRADSDSFPAMKAFTHAVNRLKGTTGINFGYLAVDDCYSPLTINRLLSKIMSGDLAVVCKYTHVTLDPKKIVVSVGAQSSPVTIAVLPTLQNLNIPLISYSSTNPGLDNRITYPYFSRTVISDTQQAIALSLVVQQLNVTFVGAIVFGNTYGRALYQAFREKAESQGICVDDAFEATEETTANDFKPLLKRYRERDVSVIVAFIMDKVALTVTEAVEYDDTFVFISSEAWGRLYEVIDGDKGERVRGSLILEPIGFNVDYGFKSFIQSWSQADTETNDWLRKFWENYFDCNLPRGFNNIHDKSCHGNFSSTPLDEIEEAPLVMHASVATIAAGVAVRNLIGDVTKEPDDVLPLDPQELSEMIRDVTLTSSDGTSFRPFRSTGNGNNGFRVFNVHQVGTSLYSYEEVGTFRNEELTLDNSKLRFYDTTGRIVPSVESSCQYMSECDHVCKSSQATVAPTKPTVSPEPVVKDDDDDGPDLVVIILAVVVGVLFLFIIVAILLAVLTCTGCIHWSRNGKNSNNNAGFTSYYHDSSNSVPGRSHESQSSSSVAASAVSNRPPLPLRKRKDTVSLERFGPGYTNKAFSDIITMQPGGPGQDFDSDRSRSRSLSVEDTRRDRATPSPHRFQGTELVGSLVSSSSAASTSGQSDSSLRPKNPNNSGALYPYASVQMNDSQRHQLERPLTQMGQVMSPGHQLQNYPMDPSLSQFQKFNQQQQQQQQPQKPGQVERLLHSGRNSRLPHEELRLQQQLVILQELQKPDLDESIKQQYLALLHQIQRPNTLQYQPQAPKSQQHPMDTSLPQSPQPFQIPPQQQQTGHPQVVLGDSGRAVFFSNITDANAIYTLPPSSPRSAVSSSKNPDYIYVLTAEGMVNPVPYETYARLQSSGMIRNPITGGRDSQGALDTNPVYGNISENQRYQGDGTKYAVAHVAEERPSLLMSDGRAVQNQVQASDKSNDGSGALVYAHISNLKKGEPSSHPYMALEGKQPDQGNTERDRGQQNGMEAKEQHRSKTKPPPSPHSKTVSAEYLTPLADSGHQETIGDLGPGIPGLVELPREAFFMLEDEPVASNAHTPPDGLPQAPNHLKAPQLGSTTYTVASSDYPVKLNQTRMSPVPQKASFPPMLQNVGQLPGHNIQDDPQNNNHANKTASDVDSFTISSVNKDGGKDVHIETPLNTEMERSLPSENVASANREADIDMALGERGEADRSRSAFMDGDNHTSSLNSDRSSLVGAGQKHVHGAGLAIPQHPDILENAMESHQSMTEV